MLPIIDCLLEKRGISLVEQDHFLHPDFERDLFEPKLLKGMKPALERLEKAFNSHELVAIFGDYDADGVPATALLGRALRELEIPFKAFIPNRVDGYGLNQMAVEKIVQSGAKLLVTVDNGMVAKPEIAALAELGVETIVCDHHEPEEENFPTAALAVINPKQKDCPYPFKELCGAALAWKMIWTLYIQLGKKTDSLKWWLDLVGLATVADMVPLVGENRVLAYYGLKVLQQSRNLGLQALAKEAGVDLKQVKAGHIGFRLAPRINAPSRMHKEVVNESNMALRLLLTQDEKEAQEAAVYLNQQNIERQEDLESSLKEALPEAETKANDLVLVVYQAHWSSGLIGLLAGRLMERYKRPVVVLANEGSQIKGSVRSVNGVSAVQMLEAANQPDQIIARYGGHQKAAGLTLAGGKEMVEILRERLNQHLRELKQDLPKLARSAVRVPDLRITSSELNLQLAQELEMLEPYGIGFLEPLFFGEFNLRQLKLVGSKGQHLSLVLEKDGVRCRGIAFKAGDWDIQEGKSYWVEFNLQLDEWQGQKRLACQIHSIQTDPPLNYLK
jgi:single-stranded-DNA-specific exonuclease